MTLLLLLLKRYNDKCLSEPSNRTDVKAGIYIVVPVSHDNTVAIDEKVV